MNTSNIRRRFETAIIFWIFTEFLLLGPFSAIYLTCLLFTPFCFVSIFYFLWMLYDKDTCNKGGRPKKWYRNLPVWKMAAEYFPVKLYKTTDLDPNKNYIIGYHPHGFLPSGLFVNFVTEATGFSEQFPGINPRMIVLDLNFWMPFRRETLLLGGICSSNRESIEWIIGKNGKGNAAVISVGGAQESLDAVPNTMELTLKNRKGFVKLALKHGASLVPCITFGENELFTQKMRNESSVFKKLQRKFTHYIGVAPPICRGRGIFQEYIGLLPYRKPLNTIGDYGDNENFLNSNIVLSVGKPIDVEKIERPSVEDVNGLHALYVKSVSELFYANREAFASKRDMQLVIK